MILSKLDCIDDLFTVPKLNLFSECIDRSVLPEPLIEAIARTDRMESVLAAISAKQSKIIDRESEFEKEIEGVLAAVKEDRELIQKCPLAEQETFNSDPGWTALSKRLGEIESAFDRSKAPTQTFLDAAKLTSENLAILAKGIDHVKTYLPSVDVNDEDTEAIQMVNQLISKIKEMEQQRTQQAELLHKELEDDDITGKLAGEPEMIHSEIFIRELQKHEKRIGYLRQNLAAQENILSVLDDARVNYAHVYRKKREANQLYDEKISHLIAAAQHSDELMKKLHSGEELLNTLSTEMRKVGGALDAAAGMRRSMMKKFVTPARPNKPKPEQKPKMPKMNPELEAELKALGLEDDADFLEFLAQSDMDAELLATSRPGDVDVPPTVPANIPSLPGIPKARVAAAMGRPVASSGHLPVNQAKGGGYGPRPPPMSYPSQAPTTHAPTQPAPSAVEQYYANMAKYEQARPNATQSTQFHTVQPTPQQQQQFQQPTPQQQQQQQFQQPIPPPATTQPSQFPQQHVDNKPPISQQQQRPSVPAHHAAKLDDVVSSDATPTPPPPQHQPDIVQQQQRRQIDAQSMQLQQRQQQQAMHEQQLRQQHLQLQQKEEYLRKQQHEFEQRQKQIQQQQQEQFAKQQSELRKQTEQQQYIMQQQQQQQQYRIQQQQHQDQKRQQMEQHQLMQQKQQIELEKQNLMRHQQQQQLDKQSQMQRQQQLDQQHQADKQKQILLQQEQVKQAEVEKQRRLQQDQQKMQQSPLRPNQQQFYNQQQMNNQFGGDHAWLMKYRQQPSPSTIMTTAPQILNGTPTPRTVTPSQMTPPPRALTPQRTTSLTPQQHQQQQQRFYSPKLAPINTSSPATVTPHPYTVPHNLPPPLLPNNQPGAEKAAEVKIEKVAMPPTEPRKASSNFALLSDFSSIPKMASNQPDPVRPSQNGTQRILDQVNQLSQQQQVLKMNQIDPSVIATIQRSAFPPDQLRNKNRTHAASRCCSTKNRQQSAVPFDDNRVKLQSAANDYINCSRVTTNMAEFPHALVAETPLPENQDDVWRVIWDEQVRNSKFYI